MVNEENKLESKDFSSKSLFPNGGISSWNGIIQWKIVLGGQKMSIHDPTRLRLWRTGHLSRRGSWAFFLHQYFLHTFCGRWNDDTPQTPGEHRSRSMKTVEVTACLENLGGSYRSIQSIIDTFRQNWSESLVHRKTIWLRQSFISPARILKIVWRGVQRHASVNFPIYLAIVWIFFHEQQNSGHKDSVWLMLLLALREIIGHAYQATKPTLKCFSLRVSKIILFYCTATIVFRLVFWNQNLHNYCLE